MDKKPRLGIDLGSTDIKAAWMTPLGETRSIETIPMPVNTENSQITHPPDLLLKRIRSIPDRYRFTGDWEAAIASQRSSFILWEAETGKPVMDVISWRDRRGEQWIDELSENQFDTIRSITGLRPEAGYSLSKLAWILERKDGLREQAENNEIRYGSLDSWLVWHATSGEEWFMEPTQASRTLLFDPRENNWSDELLKEFDIPRNLLPPIQNEVDSPIPAEEVWPNGHIVGLIGDQPAATIGGQPPSYSKTRVTLGTGGFVASPCERDQCPPGLTLTFTPSPNERIYQSEGVVLSAGRAIDWFKKVIGINLQTIEAWASAPWPEELPLWCPALNGVGAPFWSNRAASLREFSEETSARELAQGLVVSILFRIQDILDELPIDDVRIILDGGLTRMQALPDIAASIW
ncbi:MAG: FGGY family carbohydrate kinase, partial [bacterium]